MAPNKDWKGNTQAVMATLNASSHSEWDRAEQDYYATPPKAVEQLLEKELFTMNILEPACGEGHISKVLISNGYNVTSADIINRNFEWSSVEDFLLRTEPFNGSIVTNPPFSMAMEFAEKSLSLIPEWHKVAMLLRIQFLEGVKRHKMFQENPPIKVYVFSRNIRCAKNWDFDNATGNASTYCWFVWKKWYKGNPEIDWII